ncbi:MAG: ribonuclease P protein component [Bacteroidota bacterium]
MQQTLPKSIILRGFQSFSRIISNGRSIHETLLSGYVAIRPDSTPGIHIGFTASKRRVPLAARRNKIKRLMKESARKTIHEIGAIAEKKSLCIEVVLSYKGGPGTDIRRLSLDEINRDWLSIHRQILEMV